MRYVLLALLVFVVGACSGTAAKQMTPQDVVTAIQAAGLTADSAYAMEPQNYGMAPALCKGMRFTLLSDTSFKTPLTYYGEAFVCDNADDQAKLKKWYDELGRISGAFAQYTYTKGPVLLVIDAQIGKDAADKYGAALP